ncbi:myeloid-associated differentiation marker-like [Phascolarctos cinereus]|uniref:Myeloid-associated differentiation marker-like n=1 Tax=Phascolarctos cinereus TaxID=38626 RepID=A0A6P5JWS5_PHACI|nr:myeloid-associated differentiation marker-like [Phascolarctos cinereus]
MLQLKLVPRALLSLVGLLRLLQVVLCCITFSLAASGPSLVPPFGVWCLCSWCICFLLSLVILGLEFLGLNSQLPLSWENFTSVAATLATLLTFTASIMYPIVFVPRDPTGWPYQAAATATALSCVCFVIYAVEVGLTWARRGQLQGFLSTVPGLLKVFEAYVAYVILALVDVDQMYAKNTGCQWCMAVFCFCFVGNLVIVGFSIGQWLGTLPLPVDKVLVALTGLASLLYLSAAIVWPIFIFKDTIPNHQFSSAVGATILTYINLVAYTADLVFSSRMMFFTEST